LRSLLKRKTCFTPLDETIPAEDIDDGSIVEGVTLADIEALEELGFPRYISCSKNLLKEKYGYDHPWQINRHPLTQYYTYQASKDKRYLRFKKYNLKELATLCFTFVFYEKMTLDLVDWYLSLQKKQMDVEIELRLVKGDLRATLDKRLIELAKRIKLK